MDLNDKRVLLVKQSSLGDIIHTFPVVHAFKRCYPSCSLGWVVEQSFSSLVAQDPAVDRVYPIHIPSTSNPDSKWSAYFQALVATVSVLQTLRTAFQRDPYDLVLDLHASFRSGLFSWMNPGGVRVGFSDARELNTLFQKHLIKVKTGSMHAVDKNLLFCSFFGCQPIADDFFLVTSQNDDHQAETFLTASGVHPGQPFVYINPAARWQSKFWIKSKWSELCDRLQATGVPTIFGGSNDDIAYINSIRRQMTNSASVAAGRLSLTESVALMKKAAVYVGLDTGPMHIAAMTGTPVVALFGPTHPERVGPYGVKSAVIQAGNLDCLCCRKRVCDHQNCMNGIDVATVYDRVMAFMEPVAAQ
jgi:heptosyltransferase I